MCPALNFTGAFFVIAVKEEGSEIIHIDWSDGRKTMTWVFPVRDWEGGKFVAPQIGVRVPIFTGHLFGVMVGTVAHFAASITSG
jgi:hypothetical protein